MCCVRQQVDLDRSDSDLQVTVERVAVYKNEQVTNPSRTALYLRPPLHRLSITQQPSNPVRLLPRFAQH